MILICTGLILRNTKISFILRVTSKRNKEFGAPRVEQENTHEATKFKIARISHKKIECSQKELKSHTLDSLDVNLIVSKSE